MKKISASFISLLMLLSIGVISVHAQVSNPTGGPVSDPTGGPISNPPTPLFTNPLKPGVGDTLPQLLESIINNIILPIGGILCVLAFIYTGFRFVMAGGNETEIKEARRALLYACIGTVLLLGSKAIADLLQATLKQVTG